MKQQSVILSAAKNHRYHSETNFRALILLLFMLLVGSASAGDLREKVLSRSSAAKTTNTTSSLLGKITAIGVERVSHFVNPRPAFCAFFYDDETVKYEGYQNVEKRGKYEGSINQFVFEEFARFICDVGFFDQPAHLRPYTTDSAEYIVWVRTKDGEKLVHDPNMGEFCNSRIWAIVELAEKFLASANLKPVEKQSQPTTDQRR